MKYQPKVGDRLYTHTPCNLYYITLVKNPYTITEVKGNTAKARECKLVFNGAIYYNTMPDRIEENPNGREITLRWNEKRQRWIKSPITNSKYPTVAEFGEWEYFPYLD